MTTIRFIDHNTGEIYLVLDENNEVLYQSHYWNVSISEDCDIQTVENDTTDYNYMIREEQIKWLS